MEFVYFVFSNCVHGTCNVCVSVGAQSLRHDMVCSNTIQFFPLVFLSQRKWFNTTLVFCFSLIFSVVALYYINKISVSLYGAGTPAVEVKTKSSKKRN